MQQVLIAERYRLLHTVGKGGMGRVWLARDEMLHRDVAVKEIVPPEWMAEEEREELRARTMREARTAARLSHPDVVRLYDVVWADESPWIVMEYVPSRSLQQVLETDGPVTPYRAAEIGLHVLAALRAAHRAGVLHRDVKPHNVLLAEDGRVVLTDFGLATFDGADGAMTRPGIVMGSPQYVAPERAADGSSTVEADLWSLGATLHAAVEGRSPYARPTSMATLSALATAPPDPAPHAGPLAPVLAGLLRKDPRKRATAAEAERWLRKVLENPAARQRVSRSGPTGPFPATATGRVGAATGRVIAAPTRGRVRWAVVATLVLLLLVVFGGVLINRALSAPGPGPAGPSAPARSAAGGTGCGDPPPEAGAVSPGAAPPPGGRPTLPAGWTWYADPAGFRLAAPVGWLRFGDGRRSCFREPGGVRTLGVDPTVDPPADPVGYWRAEEQRLVGNGALPGYQQIGIGPLDGRRDAAVWEFRWRNEGEPRHVWRLLLRAPAGRAYALSWSTREADWPTDAGHLRLVRQSLQPA